MKRHLDHPQLAPAVGSKLRALGRRIRRYVWLEGVAVAVACLGVAFWVSLGLDWLFEPPVALRGVLLGVVSLGLAWVLFRRIARRAFVPIRSHNLAMLLERYFPEFDESLVTAVELTGRAAPLGPYGRQMLAGTCRRAAEPIGEVRLGKVFNPVPLRLSMLAAALLAAGIWTFALVAPEALAVWARRSLLLHDEIWPRKTRLIVEGFDGGLAKVARGADLEVIAKADLAMPLVPGVVRIRYRAEDGPRLGAAMSRVGIARAGKERFQEYSHTFQGVLTPIRFDVIGGDDAVRDLRIEVVDRPALVDVVLDCRFPAYMDRPPQSMTATSGVTQLPAGTQITVRATANKDLLKVEIDEGGKRHVHAHGDSRPFRSFAYSLADFADDKVLRFTLFDVDGIKSPEPVRLALAAVPDGPPQLAVELWGIGSAVTPLARLPAVGQITDDYGIARIWFELTVDQQDPATFPIQSLSGNLTEVDLESATDVADLALAPGQRLLVSVKAADRYDLDQGPHVGTSESWALEVVTPEQLRTILEARELVLRQRLERIVEEVAETRELLVGLDFGSVTAADKEVASQNQDAEGEPGAEEQDAGLGDPSHEAGGPSADHAVGLVALRLERAVQNSRKNARETLGVADAIADVREQLINNRIDTEELKMRLQAGIADPLRQIADQSFPELERRLERLRKALAGVETRVENRHLATAQVEAVLQAIQEVLQRMLELEDFNKAIELLREIIDAQQELSEETKGLHTQRLRELLED